MKKVEGHLYGSISSKGMWQDEILSQCFMGLQNWRYIWKDEKMLLCRFDMKRQKCLITLKAKIHRWECVLCLENYPMEKPCSFLSFNNCQSLLYTSYWYFFVSLSHLKHISVWSHLYTCAHIYYPDKIFKLILKPFLKLIFRRRAK